MQLIMLQNGYSTEGDIIIIRKTLSWSPDWNPIKNLWKTKDNVMDKKRTTFS